MKLKRSRDQIYEFICNARLTEFNSAEIQNAFLEMDELYIEGQTTDNKIRNVMREYIEFEFRGAPNLYLETYIKNKFNSEVVMLDKPEDLLPCPCCGAKALDELYNITEGTGYDICPNCGWEDDGTKSFDEVSSVNHGSISDYLSKLDGCNKACLEKHIPRWEFEK